MNLNQPNAQQLGNYPAFPTAASQSNGITYRQWLVGMIAAGVVARPTLGITEIEQQIQDLVDAILMQEHARNNPSIRSPGTGSPEYTA